MLMRNIVGKAKFSCKLVFGKLFRACHSKQFSRDSIFYGIPRINRADRLRCGAGLKVNGNVFINADGGVQIGERVTLSYGVTILASSYDIDRFFQGERVHNNSGITIGNDVWIGANAIVLDGVHICDHVIVGAGAVVAQDITDSYSIYAGVPAKRLRTWGAL